MSTCCLPQTSNRLSSRSWVRSRRAGCGHQGQAEMPIFNPRKPVLTALMEVPLSPTTCTALKCSAMDQSGSSACTRKSVIMKATYSHYRVCAPQTSVNTVGRAGRSNNSVARVIFALLYSEQVFRLRPNICKSTVSCQTHFLLKCTSQGRRNCGGALRNVGICQ